MFKEDILTIYAQNQEITISLSKIQRLEIIRGKKSNTGKGMKIGALTGGIGLGLVAATSVSCDRGRWFTPTQG